MCHLKKTRFSYIIEALDNPKKSKKLSLIFLNENLKEINFSGTGIYKK